MRHCHKAQIKEGNQEGVPRNTKHVIHLLRNQIENTCVSHMNKCELVPMLTGSSRVPLKLMGKKKYA